jgi:hypothetical protein
MWSNIKRFAADWGSHLTFGDYVFRIGSFALSLGGGGVMSWTAAATEWLQAWGPIAIAASGLAGFAFVAFSLAGVYALVGWSQKRRAEAALHSMLATQTRSINPLATRFMSERINLGELQMHPLSLDFPQDGKVFSDCWIVGPGTMALVECTFNGIRFPGCNIARFNSRGYVMPNILFKNCTFINCTFMHITLFLRDKDEAGFRHQFPGIRFIEELDESAMPLEGTQSPDNAEPFIEGQSADTQSP